MEPGINDAGMHNRDVSICYKLHYKPGSIMPLIHTSLTCYCNTSLENGSITVVSFLISSVLKTVVLYILSIFCSFQVEEPKISFGLLLKGFNLLKVE